MTERAAEITATSKDRSGHVTGEVQQCQFLQPEEPDIITFKFLGVFLGFFNQACLNFVIMGKLGCGNIRTKIRVTFLTHLIELRHDLLGLFRRIQQL